MIKIQKQKSENSFFCNHIYTEDVFCLELGYNILKLEHGNIRKVHQKFSAFLGPLENSAYLHFHSS